LPTAFANANAGVLANAFDSGRNLPSNFQNDPLRWSRLTGRRSKQKEQKERRVAILILAA
jgi:hypothetical protein